MADDHDRRPMVAVTRSAEDNRSLTDRLERLGFAVTAIPLIEVVGPTDGGRALAAALAELGRYRWVVLTSVNGVRSVVAARSDRRWPADVSVAVVGPATAAAARSVGLPVALVPDEATAAALVEAFPCAGADADAEPDVEGDPDPHPDAGAGDPVGRRVLAPLAALAGDTVTTGLTARGWLVDRVDAYRTVIPEVSPGQAVGVAGGRIDAVAFFSPSVVDRWVDRFGVGVPFAACVGPSTADRARNAASAGWRWPTPTPKTVWSRSSKRCSARSLASVTFPQRRMRRLRRTPTLRRLVAETSLSVDDLVAPLFVREGIDGPQPDRVLARCGPAHPGFA